MEGCIGPFYYALIILAVAVTGPIPCDLRWIYSILKKDSPILIAQGLWGTSLAPDNLLADEASSIVAGAYCLTNILIIYFAEVLYIMYADIQPFNHKHHLLIIYNQTLFFVQHRFAAPLNYCCYAI